MRRRWLSIPLAFAVFAVALPAAAQDPPPKSATRAPVKAKRRAKDPGPVAHFPGFEMVPGGGSRVFVDLSRKVEVTEHKTPGGLVYVLKDAHVDSYNNQNPLETYYYNTPVLRVRLRTVKKETSLLIALRGDVKATFKLVEQRYGGFRLEVEFPAGDYPANGPVTTPPLQSDPMLENKPAKGRPRAEKKQDKPKK